MLCRTLPFHDESFDHFNLNTRRTKLNMDIVSKIWRAIADAEVLYALFASEFAV